MLVCMSCIEKDSFVAWKLASVAFKVCLSVFTLIFVWFRFDHYVGGISSSTYRTYRVNYGSIDMFEATASDFRYDWNCLDYEIEQESIIDNVGDYRYFSSNKAIHDM